MGITQSPLSQNNGNLLLLFFGVNYQILSGIVFMNGHIWILTGLTG